MIVGNNGANTVFLNDGFGVFTEDVASTFATTTTWTRALALGDVNDDRKLDVVLANWNEPNQLILNHGSGVFSEDTSFAAAVSAENTRVLAIGDVDNDGGTHACMS